MAKSEIINVHPQMADALRKLLGVPAGGDGELEAVSGFVLQTIAAFRRLPGSGAPTSATPHWPPVADEARVPLPISAAARGALSGFLHGDWAATGAGYSDFLRRGLALTKD